VSFGVGKSAEIDDMFDACFFCGAGERSGSVYFEGCVTIPSRHVVDEVISSMDAIECVDEGGG
jgi:hypothetical protein